MLFEKALQQLKDGYAVRRLVWPIAEGYLKILPGMKHVWKIVLLPNPNAGNFIFSVEDFDAEDWIIVDAHNPFPEEQKDKKEEAEVDLAA